MEQVQEKEKDIQDYIVAIRKRKKAIIAIFSVIVLFTVMVALLLPAIYESNSTILIEQQEIPSELVMSTVTSYAAERIQTIQARVMSRTNLLKIIEKFNLYEDERKFETRGEIIQRIQEDVSLDIISANVIDPRTGRPSSATIAFSLAFRGENPSIVQRVASELTTLYLNENLTSRAEKASETSVFFKEGTERLGRQINELESKLAVFKQQHADALPELQGLNLNLLQRKEAELATVDSMVRTLDEKIFYLNGQLALIEPGSSDVPGAVERLKLLQATYSSVRSKYSEEHPDVIRLKSEIESLEKESGVSDNGDAIAEQLKQLDGELAQKKKTYTKSHPDVVGLEEKIKALNIELKAVKSKPFVEHYKAKPDNPLYITIESQLAGLKSEISSMRIQRKEVLQKIDELENSLFNAPQVEREYLTLKRDYDNALGKYHETKAKQMQADVAEQLESESKGEKFTLIDPAQLPEKPVSPNRPAIMFLGLILALGCALGFAIAADVISGAVRGARSIGRALGALPLSVIPYEMNLQDKSSNQRIKKRVVILFIAVIVFALLFIHFVMTPLDVLWFRGLRKIDKLMA